MLQGRLDPAENKDFLMRYSTELTDLLHNNKIAGSVVFFVLFFTIGYGII